MKNMPDLPGRLQHLTLLTPDLLDLVEIEIGEIKSMGGEKVMPRFSGLAAKSEVAHGCLPWSRNTMNIVTVSGPVEQRAAGGGNFLNMLPSPPIFAVKATNMWHTREPRSGRSTRQEAEFPATQENRCSPLM